MCVCVCVCLCLCVCVCVCVCVSSLLLEMLCSSDPLSAQKSLSAAGHLSWTLEQIEWVLSAFVPALATHCVCVCECVCVCVCMCVCVCVGVAVVRVGVLCVGAARV